MKATLPAIAAEIRAMIESSGIYTTRPHHDLSNLEHNLVNAHKLGAVLSRTYVRFEQSFGIEVSISISPRVVEATRRDRTFKRLHLDIELNAPSGLGDIASANAKLALLRRVTDLAALIHAAFDGIEIDEKAA